VHSVKHIEASAVCDSLKASKPLNRIPLMNWSRCTHFTGVVFLRGNRILDGCFPRVKFRHVAPQTP